jgi:hypothetical protein
VLVFLRSIWLLKKLEKPKLLSVLNRPNEKKKEAKRHARNIKQQQRILVLCFLSLLPILFSFQTSCSSINSCAPDILSLTNFPLIDAVRGTPLIKGID